MSATCSRCGAPAVLDMDGEPMYVDSHIADLESQLAAMQPMIEKAEAKAKEHQGWFTAANDHRRCDCAPCQWYRDYEARKPEDK